MELNTALSCFPLFGDMVTTDDQFCSACLGREVRLRLLATSDLHMQLVSFDYFRDRETEGGSLAKIATLIGQARAEAVRNGQLCLLLDNGDTLQGNPLADYLSSQSPDDIHPMIASMNQLGYDAVGLGNHDFDFGLDFLSTRLKSLSAAVVCSNLRCEALGFVKSEVLIARQAIASDGECVTLHIGVLSTAPDKTAIWNRHHLSGRARFGRPISCLRDGAARLKDQGADLIVVLAHMGLPLFDEGSEAQNKIREVATLEEVSAIVGGHTHLRFPEADCRTFPDVDQVRGLVGSIPFVQPGVGGSDLGQIDLCLWQTEKEGAWRVASPQSSLKPADANTPEDPAICAMAERAHQATRRLLAQPAARMSKPMHSYFALAQPSPVTALLAAAKRHAITRAIHGSHLEELPLLSVASATLSGGFDGPGNFISLSAGEIKRRHIAGLNPYANQVWAVRTTGERLMDWLERSAIIFNTLDEGSPDQCLIDPQVPAFRYDAIHGLSYVIDPRRPPKFDPAGRLIPGHQGRITEISWQGHPLDPAQEFLVATTDHRAGGGGLYRPFEDEEIVVQGQAPLQAALLDYLAASDCTAVRLDKPWCFARKMNCTAILLTAPGAARHLDDISDMSPEPCGLTIEGFLRLRLHL